MPGEEEYSRTSPSISSKSVFAKTAQPTLAPPVARRQETQWQSVRATALPVTR